VFGAPASDARIESNMIDTIQSADGRRLAYAQWGDSDGRPVFFLHGTPGCRLDRPERERRLREVGVRAVTYDRPGYGASDRHRGRCVADCAGDVRVIADALGLDQFAVVGRSGGGPHALAVAAGLPERVTRSQCHVGLAPYPAEGLDWLAGMDPENVKEINWALEGEDRLFAELGREAAEAQVRVAADPASLLEGFELPAADLVLLQDPEVQQVMREAMAEMFVHGVAGWVDDDLSFVTGWGVDLESITVPVEVRFGASDVLVPASHGDWLAAHLPGATAAVETGKGHVGDPDEMIEHLRRAAYGD
jgi:pimeloyl-ACP methyl ester carboxylesterase